MSEVMFFNGAYRNQRNDYEGFEHDDDDLDEYKDEDADDDTDDVGDDFDDDEDVDE